MPKRSAKQPKPKDIVPNEDFSQLSEDQTAALLEQTLARLCDHLEQSGVDPDHITGALFNHFSQRLCDVNDREQYDLVLEMALETPWDEHVIH